MSVLYILAADGNHTPLEETEALVQLRQGTLGPETFYWKEGMAEWRPLKELVPAAPTQIIAPVFAQGGPPRFALTMDLTRLTIVVKVLLMVSLGVSCLRLVNKFVLLGVIYTGNLNKDTATTSDRVTQFLTVTYLLVMLATSIPFLKWMYRANLNCRGFNAQGMTYTPGWCIGSFFVPFANLVWPYQAMKEIWQASTDPQNWSEQPGSSLLGWWWGLWLVLNLSTNLYVRLSVYVKDPETLAMVTLVGIFAHFIAILAAIAAFLMVGALYRKQKQLVEQGVAQEYAF